MREDRLRHDDDKIENLEDLIEARNEVPSDPEVPDDIDVDDALTFPHPKHKKDRNDGVELMGTPRKGEVGVNWSESQAEMLPSDYTDADDLDIDDDEASVETQIGEIGHLTTDDIADEQPILTRLPKGFHVVE